MWLLDASKDFGGRVISAAAKNSPTILAGVAGAGVFLTGVMAFKAGLKAKDILDAHKDKVDAIRTTEELSDEQKKEEEKKVTIETAKKIAPIALPVVGVAAATAACALGSNTINLRRQAVLTAAFELAQANALDQQNYISEAKRALGIEKDAEIEKKLVEEEKKAPVDKTTYRYINEDMWCRDLQYGSKFKSSRIKIKEAFLNVKEELLDMDCFRSVNDLYEFLGLEGFDKGENDGWNPGDNVYCNFGSEVDENGEIVLTFSYKTYKNHDAICLD